MKNLIAFILLFTTYLSFGNTATDTTTNNGANNPKFKLKNPHSSRYFFAPSAINIKKGEGYYQNTYFLLNSINYGVTDNFSIGGGVVFPLRGYQVIYFTPKVSVPILKKWRVSAGIFSLITRPNYKERGDDKDKILLSSGLLFANTTIGNENTNITIGFGLAYGNDVKKNVLNVNGLLRVSNRIVLIAENYFFKVNSKLLEPNVGIISGGVSVLSEKIVVDLGLTKPIFKIKNINLMISDYLIIPYVGVTFKLKRKKKKE